MDLSPGSRLGNYEIVEVVGRGGMGVVYKAVHTGLGRVTALKVLHDELAADEEFVRRFTREARLAAHIAHPSIAAVYDFGHADGRHYIAMAFADGVPLSRMLTEPLPLDLVSSIASQVCDALTAAHRAGVVHRDLKPANILVSATGRAALTDFGIAKAARSDGLTVAGTLVGTPEYMAPEQAMGRETDQRADIYSLGVIIYEACTGHPPFQADTAVSTALMHVSQPVPRVADEVPDIPPWVDGFVSRCCAKDPCDRFATAEEAKHALPPGSDRLVPVYPDVLERAGVRTLDGALTGIVRGEAIPSEVIAGHPEWEAMVRNALERDVAVVSLDVVGSRQMKREGATVLLSYLFERFRRFIDATCDAHGCVAKSWSGDGLTALFHDPRKAVEAMREVIRRLPDFETPDPGQPFHVRVGVHAGRVLIPSSTELGRVTSRVFDAAGHIQKQARPDELWVTEEVIRRAGLEGQFEPWGSIAGLYVYAWRESLAAAARVTGAAATRPLQPSAPPSARARDRGGRRSWWIVAGAAALVLVALGLIVWRLTRPPGAPSLPAGQAPAATAPSVKTSPTVPAGAREAVTGTVVGPDGFPILDATVTAWDGSNLLTVSTSMNGQFSIAGLPDGPRVLSVSRPGSLTEHVTVNVTSGSASTGNVVLRPADRDPSGPPRIDLGEWVQMPDGSVGLGLVAANLDVPCLIKSGAAGEQVLYLEFAASGAALVPFAPEVDAGCVLRAVTSKGAVVSSPVQGPAAVIDVLVSAGSRPEANLKLIALDLSTGRPAGRYETAGQMHLDKPGTYAVGVQCLSARSDQPVRVVLMLRSAEGIVTEHTAELRPWLNSARRDPARSFANMVTVTVDYNGAVHTAPPRPNVSFPLEWPR